MTQWIVTLCEQDAIVKLKEAGADELLVSVPFFSLRAARVFPAISWPNSAQRSMMPACGSP